MAPAAQFVDKWKNLSIAFHSQRPTRPCCTTVSIIQQPPLQQMALTMCMCSILQLHLLVTISILHPLHHLHHHCHQHRLQSMEPHHEVTLSPPLHQLLLMGWIPLSCQLDMFLQHLPMSMQLILKIMRNGQR